MWASWIPIAAQLVSSAFGYSGQQDTNETNIQLGREQMAFQERMSSTAYQRAVDDMQDAGLNPMLAYSQGGASSPAGAMPQVQNATAAAANSAGAAMQMMQGMQQISQSEAQSNQLNAAADKLKSETIDNNINTAAKLADIDLTRHQSYNAEEDMYNKQAAHLGINYDSMDKRARYLAMIDEWGKKDSYSADAARKRHEAIKAMHESVRTGEEAEEAGYSKEITRASQAEAQAGEKFFKETGSMNKYIRMLLDVARGTHSAGSLAKPIIIRR